MISSGGSSLSASHWINEKSENKSIFQSTTGSTIKKYQYIKHYLKSNLYTYLRTHTLDWYVSELLETQPFRLLRRNPDMLLFMLDDGYAVRFPNTMQQVLH
jgi:hypothetical protein